MRGEPSEAAVFLSQVSFYEGGGEGKIEKPGAFDLPALDSSFKAS